jgi:hypothetical protein
MFCPVAALSNHLKVNAVPLSAGTDIPLFAFRNLGVPAGWSHLTKFHFLSFTTQIYRSRSLENVFGHSYRIGGSFELLIAGVSPEFVAKIGGWTSLCFLIYWRHLEQVIPAAITRAWDGQIDEFAQRQGLPNGHSLETLIDNFLSQDSPLE